MLDLRSRLFSVETASRIVRWSKPAFKNLGRGVF
jgi:hypothetical protein